MKKLKKIRYERGDFKSDDIGIKSSIRDYYGYMPTSQVTEKK
jgi:hypothetical protein